MVNPFKRHEETMSLQEALELKDRSDSLNYNYRSKISDFASKVKSQTEKIRRPIVSASTPIALAAAEAAQFNWTGWIGDFLKGFGNGYLLGLPLLGSLSNSDISQYLGQYASNMTIAEDVGTAAGFTALCCTVYGTYKVAKWGINKVRDKGRVYT